MSAASSAASKVAAGSGTSVSGYLGPVGGPEPFAEHSAVVAVPVEQLEVDQAWTAEVVESFAEAAKYSAEDLVVGQVSFEVPVEHSFGAV